MGTKKELEHLWLIVHNVKDIRKKPKRSKKGGVKMGFDVYGQKPNGKPPRKFPKEDKAQRKYFCWQEETKGAYFRNNVWWWRPLWDYVCEVCVDFITTKEATYGEYNDGYLISQTKALKISERLHESLKEGKVKEFEKQRVESLRSLNDEICTYCNGTGKRNDTYVKGTCNACKGTGKVRPSKCDYPFSEKNVREFAEFCKYSGGFKIY